MFSVHMTSASQEVFTSHSLQSMQNDYTTNIYPGYTNYTFR